MYVIPLLFLTKLSLSLYLLVPLSYRLILVKRAVLFFTSCTFTYNKLIKLAQKYVLEAELFLHFL